MSQYSYYIQKAESCLKRAKKTKDVFLKKFFYNASKGFEEKAKNLTLLEVTK